MQGSHSDRYRYFILGNITPVRLVYNSQNHAVGAQVPDSHAPEGFRWSHEHWGRIEVSEEVDEVDLATFQEATERYLARRARKERERI
ncbi:MAG TPA: hypothetical protein VJV22_07170 [Acidobacteriaceae bacterium]|nr:hypothetical protein [Acidobacteriaceae bacterium]